MIQTKAPFYRGWSRVKRTKCGYPSAQELVTKTDLIMLPGPVSARTVQEGILEGFVLLVSQARKKDQPLSPSLCDLLLAALLGHIQPEPARKEV